MLKTNKLSRISISIAISAFVLILLFAGNMYAQPTTYCNPANQSPPGLTAPTYYYCYPEYMMQYGYNMYYAARISEVEIRNSSNVLLWNNISGHTMPPPCYTFYSGKTPAVVDIGETFKFTVRVANIYGYTSYYCYATSTSYYTMRLFIDWNADGDFNDSGEWINSPTSVNPVNPTPQWRGYYQHWNPTQTALPYCSSSLMEYSYNVKIPDNVDVGKARMRVMAAYNYPYAVSYQYNYPPYYEYWSNGPDACYNGMVYNYYGWGYSYIYNYGEAEDYIIEYQLPIKSMFPSNQPPNDLLHANIAYDGTGTYPKPFLEFYSPMPAGVQLQYAIKGPLPFDDIVYKGWDKVTGSDWIDVAGKTKLTIEKATGVCALNGDGTFKSDKGGEYVVMVTIKKPGAPDKVIANNFTVSWPDDLAVYGIISPRSAGSPDYFQYPRDNPISFSVEYQNVGEYDVTKFKAMVEIYNPDGTLNKILTRIYDVANGDPVLKRKDKAIVTMDQTFATSNVGFYKIVAKCELLSSTDDEPYNDKFRRDGYEDFKLSVQYEYQASADELTFPKPTSDVIAFRPFRPIGYVANLGLNDISDVNAYFKYWPKSDPSKPITVSTKVTEIPSGTNNNKKYALFPSTVIKETGEYHGIFWIDLPDDGNLNDNKLENDFTVKAGLSGTYTIGFKNAGNARNFNTIEHATSALYLNGLSGSVIMEFTDDTYDASSPFLNKPAWDLSSAILGLGYDAEQGVYRTLTFRPSAEKAASGNSVTVRLYSETGQGIVFGQSSTNNNQNAIINQAIEPELKGRYVDNGGFITFDGGAEKSLNFEIYSKTNNHASVFYLGRGSHNITIKNCLINNQTEASKTKTFIPRVGYNAADGFKFQSDITTDVNGTYGYSAGIVNRGSISYDATEKTWGVQPQTNHHNVFEGNEIKNFGYGIMSLGIGANLNNSNQFYKFYNTNNVIKNNTISRIAGAGIFVGFEDNSEVSNNIIYKVNGTTDAFGIQAGLPRSGSNFGYNNTNLKIAGNQINEVTATNKSLGIEVNQSLIALGSSDGTSFLMPNGDDNINVNSNAVWDIRSANANTMRGGIYVTTERGTSIDMPKVVDYFIDNATIANNTVVLNNDGFNNTTAVANIAIQNTKKLTFANNALALFDTQFSGLANAAVLYQGFEVRGNPDMVMDNNAYYIANGAELVRFIETTDQSEIIEAGYINEFITLDQWKLWTGRDMTSSFGYNFVNDHSFVGTDPVMITMKSSPAPKGSILSNRGLILSNVKTDIFKNVRGQSDQNYDIGAIEFNGQPYITDIEPFGIILSGVKQNTAPMKFSDAYYQMIEDKTNFEARIYNGGINTQSQIPVTLTISVQNPDGTFGSVLTETKNVAVLSPSNFADVNYNLNDGLGKEFTPKTYYEINKEREAAGLSQYTVPSQFAPMASNVTPIYRVTVSTPLDENNNNNTKTYNFRYYVMRSPIGLMTVSNSDLTSIQAGAGINEIATKENLRKLNLALKDMGWYNDYNTGRFDIDYLYSDGWMPQTLNFVPYASVIWSDEDFEKTGMNLSVYQTDALGKFLDNGVSGNKKNLVIASQEIARLNRSGKGQTFLNNYMKLNNNYPSNPFGINGNYDQNTVKGVAIAKNYLSTIASTAVTGDDYPKPALLMFKNETPGQTFIGHIYTKLEQGKNGENDTEPYPNSERIMSVATSTLGYNSIYLGIDWRHFSNINEIIRGLSDFIEYHGGNLLPVELLSFNAEPAGKRVDISWSTASEINSAKFEVERANGLGTNFNVISEVAAKGNSVDVVKYGPVNDFDVEYGKTYTYRLRMSDKDGSVNYSDTRTVEVRGEVGYINLSEINPNPVTIGSKAELVLGNDMEVEISLYDMSGRMIQTLMKGSQTAGTHQLDIDAKSLTNGTYTLILRAGDVIITRNFQVVK